MNQNKLPPFEVDSIQDSVTVTESKITQELFSNAFPVTYPRWEGGMSTLTDLMMFDLLTGVWLGLYANHGQQRKTMDIHHTTL